MELILRVRFGNKFDEVIEIIEKVYINCVPRIVFQYIQAFQPASGLWRSLGFGTDNFC